MLIRCCLSAGRGRGLLLAFAFVGWRRSVDEVHQSVDILVATMSWNLFCSNAGLRCRLLRFSFAFVEQGR